MLLLDGTKIKSNLVLHMHSGELIGIVDVGSDECNFACLEKADELVRHALAFIVRGLCTDLKFCLSYFATTSVTAIQIMPIFWAAVGILELRCNLWLVASTADWASANCTFFRMHRLMDKEPGNEFCYRTVNHMLNIDLFTFPVMLHT